MNTAIDGKYLIDARNPCSGSHHTEMDGCFFCVHDRFLPSALRQYIVECQDGGADAGQVAGAEAMLARVLEWQAANPDKVKTPDVVSDCELDHVMNPGGRQA